MCLVVRANCSASAPSTSGQGLEIPRWVLDRPLVCEACALPESAGAAGPDADLFLDQIVIAVRIR